VQLHQGDGFLVVYLTMRVVHHLQETEVLAQDAYFGLQYYLVPNKVLSQQREETFIGLGRVTALENKIRL